MPWLFVSARIKIAKAADLMKCHFPSFRVITIICGVYSFQSKSNITQNRGFTVLLQQQNWWFWRSACPPRLCNLLIGDTNQLSTVSFVWCWAHSDWNVLLHNRVRCEGLRKPQWIVLKCISREWPQKICF